MDRASGRRDGARLLTWGRCRAVATEVDYDYPWPRRGPAVVSNGQAPGPSAQPEKTELTLAMVAIGVPRASARPASPGVAARVVARPTETESALRHTAGRIVPG